MQSFVVVLMGGKKKKGGFPLSTMRSICAPCPLHSALQTQSAKYFFTISSPHLILISSWQMRLVPYSRLRFPVVVIFCLTSLRGFWPCFLCSALSGHNLTCAKYGHVQFHFYRCRGTCDWEPSTDRTAARARYGRSSSCSQKTLRTRLQACLHRSRGCLLRSIT